MYGQFRQHLSDELTAIDKAGLYKHERFISSPQQAHVGVYRPEDKNGSKPVLNLCANNYLGLANHPDIISAAERAMRQWGYGLASVRFICGTQTIHKQLEEKLSHFLGTEDTILYSSCFDANGGLFETILSEQDAIISDQLNHASIIDGIRLCKAKRYRYTNNDMNDLEAKLKQADEAGVRYKLITTDGVFSMDGYIAQLDKVCDLAEQYKALVHFDDCHATGFLGKTGRGTHEFRGVMDRIDLTTGTLGKAVGGASGGYTSGKKEIVELLRQRSRPYLFSNSLAPAIVGATLKSLEIMESTTELRDKLESNTKLFREGMSEAGYDILPGEHPITPIMIGDAKKAASLADQMLKRGIYVIAFSYPVVPENMARIRVQVSAAHTEEDLKFAIDQFSEAQKT
ncbi:2-amino-3-ketobutyrate coenzyme A ligase [Poriferisphaera corsica]|uniref:2-amino-3-ketobutyrate coenzyme A ligase n=1 Tax=Poriferisphaera corsica TaxID=2528020 RepID=A0A517YWA9_9BACT|nr:glycine C-acetyltransferase [Poriferisphaera corsica]QDU34489.1 2-amino-3-ketobutyrate coenzyme A ligase [Poriferisphaera corsica]